MQQGSHDAIRTYVRANLATHTREAIYAALTAAGRIMVSRISGLRSVLGQWKRLAVGRHQLPDLKPLLNATRSIGRVLKKGDYIVYESTVYPGCTEEDCVPILEQLSGLK